MNTRSGGHSQTQPTSLTQPGETRTWRRPPLPPKKGGGGVRPQRHPSFQEGKRRDSRCATSKETTPAPQPCLSDSSWLWGGFEPSPWSTVEGNPGTPLTTFLPLHKPTRPNGSDQIVLPCQFWVRRFLPLPRSRQGTAVHSGTSKAC